MTDPILVRVRETLASNRAAGATFTEAWAVAMRAVPDVPSLCDDWRPALNATIAGWRAAYYGEPAARAVRACAAVA